MFKKGIISAQEIEKHRLIYLQVQKNYQNLLSNISQLKSSINEVSRNSKTTTINESATNINLERTVLQSFYQLKQAIKEWELKFVIYSSIQGTVSFLQIWAENQSINSGDNVFAVIPSNTSSYIGKLKATPNNSGKIAIGQHVNIRLANYPDSEFGKIKGRVKSISLVPDKDGNILVDIELFDGLKTTYNKQINFTQEMIGTADIITDDLRLIERIFHQFRSIFSR